MNIERWQEVADQIRNTFDVEDSGTDIDESTGEIEREFLVFSGPLGRLKVEFVSKPVLLDTKTHYSKRIGSDVEIENIYSDTERASALSVWKWDDGAERWIEFETPLFK